MRAGCSVMETYGGMGGVWDIFSIDIDSCQSHYPISYRAGSIYRFNKVIYVCAIKLDTFNSVT